MALVMAKAGANEDEKTKMDAFVAQCWRKVDMYVTLAQYSTSTTAMTDNNTTTSTLNGQSANLQSQSSGPSEFSIMT